MNLTVVTIIRPGNEDCHSVRSFSMPLGTAIAMFDPFQRMHIQALPTVRVSIGLHLQDAWDTWKPTR